MEVKIFVSFVHRLRSIDWWIERILLNMAISFDVLLLLRWSNAKIANWMFLHDDCLKIAFRSNHDLSVRVAWLEVDSQKLYFLGWIQRTDEARANVNQWKEAARDRSAGRVVQWAVHSFFSVHDNRAFDQHFTFLVAANAFDSLHHLNAIFEFCHRCCSTELRIQENFYQRFYYNCTETICSKVVQTIFVISWQFPIVVYIVWLSNLYVSLIQQLEYFRF